MTKRISTLPPKGFKRPPPPPPPPAPRRIIKSVRILSDIESEDVHAKEPGDAD